MIVRKVKKDCLWKQRTHKITKYHVFHASTNIIEDDQDEPQSQTTVQLIITLINPFTHSVPKKGH